jgi:endonuclease/exonuclease/phosphatase family metal-dependent hydrolase
LEKTKAEVVCFQEIFEKDFLFLKERFGMHGVFSPMVILDISDGKKDFLGVAILSKYDIKKSEEFYYTGDRKNIKYWDRKVLNLIIKKITKEDLVALDQVLCRVFLFVSVIKNGKEYNFSTTHFTRTLDGREDDFQKRDIRELLSFTTKKDSLILCGDFNVARGDSKIYEILKEEYKDNIPEKYDSSIDPNLHRVRGLKRMVDYIFSTNDYLVKNVELIEGVSDHKAVVGEVYKI